MLDDLKIALCIWSMVAVIVALIALNPYRIRNDNLAETRQVVPGNLVRAEP